MRLFALIFSVSVFLFLACASSNTEDTIVFAGSGGYPPFNFIDTTNTVTGFDVDVAEEIARQLGKKMKYTTTAWDGIIEGLRAGRYDAILGSMAVTPQRQEVVSFSVPYYYSGAQLLVLKKSGIRCSKDISESHTIGVTTGTTFEQDARKLGARVKLYEDDNQTLLELLNGRLDAVITDRVVGLNAIQKIDKGDKIILVGNLLRTEDCAIAFRQNNTKLRTRIDSILVKMHADSTLTRISQKWFNGVDITQK